MNACRFDRSMLLKEDRAWLKHFEKEKGRPLRVLHVGNVANNAYLNAKFLRRIGVEADVFCPNYYHVMGVPEWEELEILHDYGSDFDPCFSNADLKGYVRPSWFYQGPLSLCVEQVERAHGVRPAHRSSFPFPSPALERLRRFVSNPFGVWLDLIARLSQSRKAARYYEGIARLVPPVRPVARRVFELLSGRATSLEAHRLRELVQRFAEQFPERADRISYSELASYRVTADLYMRAFRHYDVVQGYGTSPIFMLVAGCKKYVAYEHGTLRDFTMGDEPLHRLTALAYRNATHAFITNGDCLSYANALRIPSFSAMIYPVDVEQHRLDFSRSARKYREAHGADVLLFCPLRHDWKVKGVDVHLRALPLIHKAVSGRAVLVTVAWGQQIEQSRALLRELGCAEDVVWLRPLSRVSMLKWMQAADVVLDQIALPHFGATGPQAIAAGVPVISSYVPDSTAWIVDEPAPILPAFDPAGVAAAVAKALDPEWRSHYMGRARHWTDSYHSPNRIIRDHVATYRKSLQS